MATTLNHIFWTQKVAAMVMYYKVPLTVPLYLYFALASPWQNIDIVGALTITYS